MKILYVHGLSSSGASSTVINLKRLLTVEDTVIAPDLPIDPNEAVELLSQYAKKSNLILLLGLLWVECLHKSYGDIQSC